MKVMVFHGADKPNESHLEDFIDVAASDEDTTEFKGSPLMNVDVDEDCNVTLYGESVGPYITLTADEFRMIAAAYFKPFALADVVRVAEDHLEYPKATL